MRNSFLRLKTNGKPFLIWLSHARISIFQETNNKWHYVTWNRKQKTTSGITKHRTGNENSIRWIETDLKSS